MSAKMVKQTMLTDKKYARITEDCKNNSFLSRLTKGRYFKMIINSAGSDGSNTGSAIFYGMNYIKQVSNNNIIQISGNELRNLVQVLSNKNEYPELFEIGIRINRQLKMIMHALKSIGVTSLNLWEISDRQHFIVAIKKHFFTSNKNADINEYDMNFEDLEELFIELEALLERLTILENLYIRECGEKDESSQERRLS